MRVRFTPQADRQYLGVLAHRELTVPPYRFFYRVVDDTVWIVAVWHARQLPEEPDDVARG